MHRGEIPRTGEKWEALKFVFSPALPVRGKKAHMGVCTAGARGREEEKLSRLFRLFLTRGSTMEKFKLDLCRVHEKRLQPTRTSLNEPGDSLRGEGQGSARTAQN